MKKLTFNILLSLIIQAKRQGKGRMGNGRILTNQLMIAADFDEGEKTRERNILCKFNDEVVKANAYHKIDKFIGRFLPEGRNYPYEKFKFKELEKSIGKPAEYSVRLVQMNRLCTEIFDKENAEKLVFTLLEIVRQDSHIEKLLYGDKFVSKDELFGSPVHNKRICPAALLLGLVYYTHINHGEASTKECHLYSLPEKRTFSIIEYRNESSLDLNAPTSIVGEILDAYVHSIADSKSQIVRFAMLYILPFVAKSMTSTHSYEISRAELSQAAEKAVSTFIHNEYVYQNYIAPKGMNRSTILSELEACDVVEAIIENGCFMEVSETQPHILYFSHQYYRDYFAARYILNLLEALKISYKYKSEEKISFFNKYDLGAVWFIDDDEDIYRLIGEICGDYKNADAEENGADRTILDELLDMCREFDAFRATENVIRTMALVRNNLIYDVDFSNTSLPLEIPVDIKFKECDFSECTVMLIEACDRYDEMSEHNHFKNCDFTDASFLDPDYKGILKKLGAEVGD